MGRSMGRDGSPQDSLTAFDRLMAPDKLMALDEALELMLGGEFALPDIETCPLDQALGRILARDIQSRVAVPGDDNSAMDGYALRVQDSDLELRVTQRIPAGHSGKPLEPGTAARIFTGAPIPLGADAVVMQEQCEVEGDRLRLSRSPQLPRPWWASWLSWLSRSAPSPQKVSIGENIRSKGQDIQQGETGFAAGRRLRAEDLGVLASVGCAAVPVYRRLVVAVLSTGNELVDPADVLVNPPGGDDPSAGDGSASPADGDDPSAGDGSASPAGGNDLSAGDGSASPAGGNDPSAGDGSASPAGGDDPSAGDGSASPADGDDPSAGDGSASPAGGNGLQPGQVFNSNRYTLRGLLTDLGMEVKDFGVVGDSAEATAAVLRRAAVAADCVISSGGVSVGEEDHVKNQVEALGGLHLWKLRIKPGKPLAYGWLAATPPNPLDAELSDSGDRVDESRTDAPDHLPAGDGVAVGEDYMDGTRTDALSPNPFDAELSDSEDRMDGSRMDPTPFFGLPGNPAAVFVTFLMVVRPWLLRRQGAESEEPLKLQARADFALERPGSRLEFLRARASVDGGELRVALYPNQSSGVLSSVSWANALAVVPPDTTISPGDPVEVLLL